MKAKWLILFALMFSVSCSRRGLSPEEEQYIDQALKLNEARGRPSVILQECATALALNPSLLSDTNWRQKEFTALSTMRSNAEALKQLSAPPKMRAAHDHLLKSCDFDILAVKLYEEGIAEDNTAKFRAGTDYLLQSSAENSAAAREFDKVREAIRSGTW